MKSAFLLFVIIVFSPLVNPNFARTEELRRILYGTTASPSHSADLGRQGRRLL